MKKDRKIKNKIFSKLLTLTGILFVLQSFSGCVHPHSKFSPSDSSNKKTVVITANIQNLPFANSSESEQLAKSAFPVLSDTLTYSLSYKSSGSSSAWQALRGSYPDFQLISSAGTYILKLDGFSDAEKTNLILTGQNSVTIEEDSNSKNVSFIVQPPETATGNGSIKLKLSALVNTDISAFTLTAKKTGSSTSIPLTWTRDGSEGLSGYIKNDSIESGSYTLTIKGIANNEIVYTRTEKLTVWEGLETSVWIFADGSSSNELMIKQEDLYSTFYVKGSSGTYNFYKEGVFGDVTASDTNSGSIGYPLATISAAIEKCTIDNKPYTIYVDGTIEETVDPTSVDPTAISITSGKNITIKSVNSSGETKPVIQGDGNGRIIFASGTVVLEDLALKGGGNSTLGCGIYIGSTGVLTMKNCTITDCNATISGGGLYIATNGSANLNGCTISKNTAQNGGGIYIQKGSAALTDCAITENTAKDNSSSSKGGGIYLNSGTLTTRNCTINGNVTKNDSTETSGNGSQIYAVTDSVYNGETFAADKVID